MSEQTKHDRIYLLNDPELPEAERQGILSHLEGCAECRGRLKQWGTVAHGFRMLPEDAQNPFLERKILVSIAGNPEPRKPTAWRMATYGTALAALLAVMWTAPREPAEYASLEEWALSDGAPDWLSESQALDDGALLDFAMEEL